MWQGFEAFVWLRDAYQVKQLQRARSGLLATQALVQQEDLVDLLFDVVQRVERGHRLLEDHRDAVATNTAHLLFIQGQQVAPFVVNRAGRMTRQRVGQQAQDRMGGHRLA
ncbi:hypothetical protein D3C78_647120 [compost metagenome]